MNCSMQLPKITAGNQKPRLFLVGIGGIGMSGLAQLLNYAGYEVAGSDRAITAPENQELFDYLRSQGIQLFPQDGSGVRTFRPEMLIASSAVEKGNPDFIEGIPVLHRAQALAQALENYRPEARLIAVAGSCGKTSTTGWIANALASLGQSVLMVNGGYNIIPGNDSIPGNFHCTGERPQWLVAEVDESDKSLVNFESDYAVVLNIGNDHYDEQELRRVFAQFLSRARRGIVLQDALKDIAPASTQCRIALFGNGDEKDCVSPLDYRCDEAGISFETRQFGTIHTQQYGRHSAQNACAVLALLSLLGLDRPPMELARALFSYRGVRQRFELMGSLNGIPLINDYAHNPEKIEAARSTARERYGTPLLAVFQPHGYGPLGFMRQALVETLSRLLSKEDVFIMLPVYYAGGTTSFTPSSDDIVADLQKAGVNAIAADRAKAAEMIRATPAKAVLVMGARDRSLRDWTRELN